MQRSPLALSRRALWPVGIALVLTALGTCLLQQRSWDTGWFLALNGASASVAWMASALSVIGLGVSALLMTALLGPQRARTLAALLTLLLLGGLLVQGIKSAAGSPRPVAVLGPEQVQVIGIPMLSRSMPSGHAALWGGLLALGLCAPRRAWGISMRGRRGALAVLAWLALAGGMARVLAGAHWPSDVLFGLALGLALGACIAGSLAGRRFTRWLAGLLRGRAGSRIMASALVACAAGLWVAERENPEAEWLYIGLVSVGVLAAARWWQLHPGPAMQRAIALRPLKRP